MKVKCVLCDVMEHIDQHTLQAKQLRNRRMKTYLCKTCHNRIKQKTNQRHATGKFRLYEIKEYDQYI